MTIKPGTNACPPTKEERVQFCMRLMRQQKWRRGVTDKRLAEHWGLTVDAVRQYTAEGWRRIKAEVTDPDQTAGTVCIALENVIHEASKKGMYGHRSIIEAGKAWALIAGAGAPTRVEIGALANLSDAELEKRRQEILAKLAEGDEPGPVLKEQREEAPLLPAAGRKALPREGE